MDTIQLEKIYQKAGEFDNKRKETAQIAEQDNQARLELIRQKAEERQKAKQQNYEWNDRIQAIRETYDLSEEEIQSIIHEVEQEEKVPTPITKSVSNTIPGKKSLSQKLKDRFFSHKGRLKRSTFALSMLATVIPQFFSIVAAAEGAVPLALFALAAVYAELMLIIKRFHDLGKSGKFALLAFVPFLNFLTLLYLLFFPGTEGPNSFDEEELEETKEM